jgi:hypothetical protein
MRTGSFVAIALLVVAIASVAASSGRSEEAYIRECLVGTGEGYSVLVGSDGMKYMMNDDEEDRAGWLKVLVSLRASLLPALAVIPIARDGTVFSDSDGRMTETQFARVERVLRGAGGFSGIHSVSFSDSRTPALTTCGEVVFISSRDYHLRGWRQENVHYLLHELAHVATDPPDQKTAHTLEFYRVFRILTRAAESLGKRVYDPGWYKWPVEGNVGSNGAWNGEKRWYEVAKKTLKGGYRWNDRTLEKGADWYLPGSGSFVTAAPLSS